MSRFVDRATACVQVVVGWGEHHPFLGMQGHLLPTKVQGGHTPSRSVDTAYEDN